jgi:DNA adenine methylase
MAKYTTLVKTWGGKSYLKKWIIGLFPRDYEHMEYMECFGGGGSVLLHKNPSLVETYNDANPDLVGLFERVKNQYKNLAWIIKDKYGEYNKFTFDRAKEEYLQNGEFTTAGAAAFFAKNRMSRGGLGTSYASSNRKRGQYENGDENAYYNCLKSLPYISARLQNVNIKCFPFDEFVDLFNREGVVQYHDPPYLPETRVSKKAYGDYEMTYEDHEKLLDMIMDSKAKVLLSGYDNQLYNGRLSNWNVFKKEIANHSSQQKVKPKKIECVWRNF